jgi:hypothetical protein
MDEYWEVYKEDLEMASTMGYLAAVANSVLFRMKKSKGPRIVQICGPMTTGGLGSQEANMLRFKRAIVVAEHHGLAVFNQIYLEDAINRITGYKAGGEYFVDILEILYRKIFESGYVNKVLFLPDWQSSVGACWERELLMKLGISIEEYPAEWLALL